MANNILALDIGTRSVVGVFLEKNGTNYKIMGSSIYEHEDRSMVDGQIHNIPQVTNAVNKVLDQLESIIGYRPKAAAIAAAGRSLLTKTGFAYHNITDFHEINSELIKSIELEAVSNALKDLPQSPEDYHCVGYSVVKYYLDSEPIGSLLMQKGKIAGVEIIATFLPRIVIDSLFTVMRNCNLDVKSITLEPIAASHVIIPQSMRNLNIALVDIGAGTSDIAITKKGYLFAYGMVPVAGDEITEFLGEKLILDFNTSETLKRKLYNNEIVEYTDVLGNEHIIESITLIKEIKPAVEILAKSIGEKIIEINGKSPDAIICIGGGALTPGLEECLSDFLNLPKGRIGIKGSEHLTNIEGCNENLKGSLFVTPIGIGVSALEKDSLSFINIKVNERPIQILKINKISVGEVLIKGGFNIKKLWGKPGKALTFKLNDQLKIVKGEMGKNAIIKLNGVETNLEAEIATGDIISFESGQDGKDAVLFVKDLLKDYKLKKVKANDNWYDFNPAVFMNGEKVGTDEKIIDGSNVIIFYNETVEDLLKQLDIQYNNQEFYCYINGSLKNFTYEGLAITINGSKANLNSMVKDGDIITWERVPFKLYLRDVKDELPSYKSEIEVNVNNNPVRISKSLTSYFINGEKASLDDQIPPYGSVKTEVNKEGIILADILANCNINKNPLSGRKLILKVNDKPAEFTTPVKRGDNVLISWDTLD